MTFWAGEVAKRDKCSVFVKADVKEEEKHLGLIKTLWIVDEEKTQASPIYSRKSTLCPQQIRGPSTRILICVF